VEDRDVERGSDALWRCWSFDPDNRDIFSLFKEIGFSYTDEDFEKFSGKLAQWAK